MAKLGKTVLDIDFGEIKEKQYDEVMNTLTLIFDPDFDEYNIPEGEELNYIEDKDYLINEYAFWSDLDGNLLKLKLFHFSHKGPKFLEDFMPGLDWKAIRKEVLTPTLRKED